MRSGVPKFSSSSVVGRVHLHATYPFSPFVQLFLSIGIEVTYQEIYNNLHIVLPIYNKFLYTMKQTDGAFSYSKIGKWESLSSPPKGSNKKRYIKIVSFSYISNPNDTETTTKKAFYIGYLIPFTMVSKPF